MHHPFVIDTAKAEAMPDNWRVMTVYSGNEGISLGQLDWQNVQSHGCLGDAGKILKNGVDTVSTGDTVDT